VLATLQILTITKKNLSASQTPKNALKNLPISNKICSKTKYKKRSSRPLSLTKKKKKKKRINILQKVAVQSKKQKRKRNSKTPPTKNYSWME